MTNELKPTDPVTISAHDFEIHYVSRLAYDELRIKFDACHTELGQVNAELAQACARIKQLEVKLSAAEGESHLLHDIISMQDEEEM